MKYIYGIIIGAALMVGLPLAAQVTHYAIYPVSESEDGLVQKYYDKDSNVACYRTFMYLGTGSTGGISCVKL